MSGARGGGDVPSPCSGGQELSQAIPLPRWIYHPGHGEPDRTTLDDVKALVPQRYVQVVPDGDAALRYGLALNDAGFFWECHEILEAVWKAAPQGGRDRILLRACIQVANGNLKAAMQNSRAAARLFAEAAAELDELARRAATGGGFAASYPAPLLARALKQSTLSLPVRLRHGPNPETCNMHKNA